jgi:hypothetical protein
MAKSTVQLVTAFFVLLLTSKIFADVYVYRDRDGKLTFSSVCPEQQQKEGCHKVIREQDQPVKRQLGESLPDYDLSSETVIEKGWDESILSARQWKLKRDINGDGKVTISDVPGWVKWLVYYPGDWLIYGFA